ncbi:MAG TPA: hypothetical protein VG722_10960 [Tepidisphaeraceae bacterium]|nr:hypothetical protein [Tepidisphaeraceae bacterium]
MRLELSPHAAKQIGMLSHRQGMTQLSMLSRLVRWFSEQPIQIQAAIMGQYPIESNEDLALMIVKYMAGEPGALRPISFGYDREG